MKYGDFFFCKNFLDFVDHIVSYNYSAIYCSAKAAVDNS